MSKPSHIFIVGSFRSGTTMLQRVLNCSNDVAICGETHFLKYKHLTTKGFRNEFAKIADISTNAGASKIVEHIYKNVKVGFWRWVQKNVDQEDFLKSVLNSDRSDRELFDIVMKFRAGSKPIRGEKTPAHIYDVPTLLKWFPKAKIIHIIRDPRPIYVSNLRKRSKSATRTVLNTIIKSSDLVMETYLCFNVLFTWRRIIRAHELYQKRYPERYFSLQYEGLVKEPRKNLSELCTFLEIDINDKMFSQPVINSSFSNTQGTTGFDISAVDRWRDHIKPIVNRWFVFWCKHYLEKFGYQP
jgi:hypothetical protein